MDSVTLLDVTLDIDPQVMSPYMIKQITAGRYEMAEARRVQQLIEEGDVVLELGAGIGFISSLIAADPRVTRCLSYEANPALIPLLSRNVTRHLGAAAQKWELRNAILALGTDETEVEFYIHPNFWSSTLVPLANAIRVERVAVENFETVRAELRPTLIVCDIEGAELELFRDADLTGISRVFLEVHQKMLGGAGMRELFTVFHERGFHYDQTHSNGSVILFRRIV